MSNLHYMTRSPVNAKSISKFINTESQHTYNYSVEVLCAPLLSDSIEKSTEFGFWRESRHGLARTHVLEAKLTSNKNTSTGNRSDQWNTRSNCQYETQKSSRTRHARISLVTSDCHFLATPNVWSKKHERHAEGHCTKVNRKESVLFAEWALPSAIW
jgi:hypothetical protein